MWCLVGDLSVFQIGDSLGHTCIWVSRSFWASTAEVRSVLYSSTCSRYEGVTSRVSDEVRSVCRWRQRLPRSRTPGKGAKARRSHSSSQQPTVETKTASGEEDSTIRFHP